MTWRDIFRGRERGSTQAIKDRQKFGPGKNEPVFVEPVRIRVSDYTTLSINGTIRRLAGDLGNVPDRKLQDIERRLSAWSFTPNGTEGFAKAEVTVGGISTAGLSSQTMEALHLPGLYAIGEAVDVTGWLGGYNFQWAWASGWVAAQYL